MVEQALHKLDVEITEVAIDINNSIASFALASDQGAQSIFRGVVRDINHGKQVNSIDYSAYEVLARKEMETILTEASQMWPIGRATVKHRVGSLQIGEVAIVVIISSRHRAEAFAAVDYVVKEIKLRVPIWKKEYYADGTTSWTRCHENNLGGLVHEH